MTLTCRRYNALPAHSVDIANKHMKKHIVLVPGEGLEPSRLAAPDFESGTSTSSITPAREAANYP